MKDCKIKALDLSSNLANIFYNLNVNLSPLEAVRIAHGKITDTAFMSEKILEESLHAKISHPFAPSDPNDPRSKTLWRGR